MIEVDLSEADLNDADLDRADLTQANLTGASFYRIVLTPNMMYFNLAMSQRQETRLVGAILNKANLHGARILDAQLAEASSLLNVVMPDGSNT